MSFIKLTVIVLLLLYSNLLLFSTVISNSFILEIIATWLPYFLMVNLVVGILFWLWKIRKWKMDTSKLRTFCTLSLIYFCLVTLILTMQIISFSFTTIPLARGDTFGHTIRISFLNKLYSNKNYPSIDKKIIELSPDILGLSEVRLEDFPKLESLNQYPCLLYQPSRDNANIVLASKYSCTKKFLPETLPFVLQAEVETEGQIYNVFVLHPLPPQKQDWVITRNKELKSLTNYIRSINKSNVILMGDFNTTPWSSSLQEFSKELSHIHNVAKGRGLNFTWHGIPLNTQIDHIFVSSSFKVENFQNFSVKGSDHNMISVDIK